MASDTLDTPPTLKTRTIRCEITVQVPDDLAATKRSSQSDDSAILSRTLEVATHRAAEQRITFLDAFESVGLTVADVSRITVGDATPDADEIRDAGSRWYHDEIVRLARAQLEDAVERAQEERWSYQVTRDRAWEVARVLDNHAWVIYTAQARLVLAFSDSPDAYEEVFGMDAADTSQRAYCAMESDLHAALERLADEYISQEGYNGDDDDDEDDTDDESDD